MRVIISIVIFLGINLSFSDRILAQDCKELVKKHFNSINQIKRPIGKNVYFIDFQTKYYFWDGSVKPKEIKAKVYISSNMFVFESDLYSVISDKSDLYYVDKSRLQIFKHKVSEGSGIDDKLSSIISEAENEVFEKGTLVSCSDILYQNQKVKHIIIVPPTDLQDKYSISQLEYFINPQNDYMNKSVVTYTKDYRIKKLEVEYFNVSLNYKNWKYKNSSELLFDKNGNILPRYKNYTVIDQEE